MILPVTDEIGAQSIAENIRARIEKRAIRHPLSSTGPYVTVSVGRATITPLADDKPQKIVCLADMGLYQAKSLGRNRVCTSDEGRFGLLAKGASPDAASVLNLIGGRGELLCKACPRSMTFTSRPPSGTWPINSHEAQRGRDENCSTTSLG